MTATASLPLSKFYVTGGTLPPDALSYVERQADTDLFNALCNREFCYVLNARQMGKSSLCVRTLNRLKASGVRTAFCDLTRYGGRNLTAEQWYAALLSDIGRELGLRAEFLAYWKANFEVPPVRRLFGAITEIGLSSERLSEDSPIVLFVDEIDVTLSLPFSADEFFAAIRECFIGRANNPRLKLLSICLLGTAAPTDLIQDTRVSPFNIGKRVELRDFTEAEAAPLAAGLAKDGNGAKLLARVLYWTDGHPYLTQRLCAALVTSPDLRPTPSTVDRLCNELFLSHTAKENDDNLALVRNRILKSETDLAGLLLFYREVRSGKTVKDEETNPLCSILKLSGVVKVVKGRLRVRNRIYGQVFDSKWVEAQLPGEEMRRQREAFHRGLVRALGLSSILILIFAGLTRYAFQQRTLAELSAALSQKYADEAKREKKTASDSSNQLAREKQRAEVERDSEKRLVYIADLNLIPALYESADLDGIEKLLTDPKYSRYRGFEWDYWNRLCHLEVSHLNGDAGAVHSLQFSPDGRRIVTGGWDGTVKVWNVQTGQSLLSLPQEKSSVWSVAFSPDGKTLLTGSEFTSAILSDSRTGKKLVTFKNKESGVLSVAFSPNGKRAVTGNSDGTATVWNARTGEKLFSLPDHGGGIPKIAFSPDGQRIVTASAIVQSRTFDYKVRIRDVHTGKELLAFGEPEEGIWAVAFSPDGKRIATGGGNGTARIRDARTGKVLLTLTGHQDTVWSVAYSPDGKRIATGSKDKIAKLWDAQTGQELLTIKGHRDNVWAVAFSPNGKQLVTGSRDGTVKLWDITEKTMFLTPDSHTSPFHKFLKSDNTQCVSPDGKLVVTRVHNDSDRTENNLALVSDVATQKTLFTLKGDAGDVLSVAFSADSQLVATGYTDNTAKLWNAKTGKELFTLKGHRGGITSIAFSPDGNRVLTGSRDGTVKLWDTVTGRETLTLRGYTGEVASVAFSPDGKRIYATKWKPSKILPVPVILIWFCDPKDAKTVFNTK